MSGKRRPGWIGARLDLPADLEDQAVAALWESGCLGAQSVAAMRRAGRPRVVLMAWYPGRASLATLGRQLSRSLAAAGVPTTARPRLRRVAERSWVRTWRASLRPMPIGRRLLALPESIAAPARTRRIVIRVPFGQAFGTGEHATTRLCLRLLEESLEAGDRVADLGTGTGLLAVAALRLGASHVLAVDRDPVAVRVARETLRRNRAGSRVTLISGDAADACDRGPFDLALLNIGATVAGRILPRLAPALAPGGRAVIAGHLVGDEAELLDLAARCGLGSMARLRSRPWSALLLRRPK